MRITAVQIDLEMTEFTSEGKVMPRPQPKRIVAYESEIPQEVYDWLWSKINPPKEG